MAYDNPAGLIALSVVLQILSSTAVLLRFHARKLKKCPIEMDDWLIVASLVRR